mmetsp:Transcript_77360/g.149413  ORF Transcript_77360/g.149413 Transcript_77360/m.149413 type:complete len:93 (-) Transcript_77360:13-291(-)
MPGLPPQLLHDSQDQKEDMQRIHRGLHLLLGQGQAAYMVAADHQECWNHKLRVVGHRIKAAKHVFAMRPSTAGLNELTQIYQPLQCCSVNTA